MKTLLIILSLLFITPTFAANSNTQVRLTRLNIYSVTTTGGVNDFTVQKELKKNQETQLHGCKMPYKIPYGKYSLMGRVYVRLTVLKGGKLSVQKIDGTKDHQSITGCIKRAINTWKIPNLGLAKGTEITFKLYVSFPSNRYKTYGGGGGVGYGKIGLLGSRKYGGSKYTYYKSSAKITKIQTTGALAQNVVDWTLKQVRAEQNLRYCHKKIARTAKDYKRVSGNMNVLILINKLGAFQKIEILKTTVKNAELQNCIYYEMSRKTFPPAKGKTTINLTIDFPAPTKY